MSIQEKLHGIIVPLITPLTPDEDLDEEGLSESLELARKEGGEMPSAKRPM